MKRHAFTLVELMVGATLGFTLLGGVLAPMLTRSQLNARRTACLNNIKQQTLCCFIFADEAGERFPLERTYREMKDGGADQYLHGGTAVKEEDLDQTPLRFAADRPEITYFGLTGPVPAAAQANAVFMNRLYGKEGKGGRGYFNDPRLFTCPAATTTGTLPTGGRVFGMDDGFSYGVNQRLRFGGKRPSAIIALGDMARTAGRNPWKPLTEAPSDAEAKGLNHREEGFCFGFGDGHAEWLPVQAFAGRGIAKSIDADDIFMSTGNGRDGAPPVEDIALY